MTHKLYCITSRKIMKLYGGIRGKFGSQCGHAYLHAWWNADERGLKAADDYRHSGVATKVTVAIPDMETLEEEQQFLRDLAARYKDEYGFTVVIDNGTTVFDGKKTLTGIGIGPVPIDGAPEELEAFKLLA